MLEALTSQREIRAAQRMLERQLGVAATRRGSAPIGHRGGSGENRTLWIRDFDLWYAHQDLGSRFWNAFGRGNPFESPASIAVEINPPVKGLRRDFAGAFARDEVGTIYLVHRGRVGGGRKGIGKAAFLREFPEPLEPMQEGKSASEVIVVGVVGSDRFVAEVDHFVKIVESVKRRIAARSSRGSVAASRPRVDTYRPEFFGKKRYTTRARIEANVTHGVVVDELRTAAELLGCRAFRDRLRDLYVPGKGDRLRALFEVKADASSTSVYAAVGQLFMHGGNGRAARLIAVLPEDIDQARCRRLGDLGIRVVTFRWLGSRPVFSGLSVALK